MRMVVYDSYRSVYETQFTRMMVTFASVLTDLMKAGNLFRRIKASREFRWTYASDVPQQVGPLGGCGMWVCKFLSTLIDGLTPSCEPGAARNDAMNFRYQMAEVFYSMAGK